MSSGLVLGAADRRHLEAAMSALLSPLAYESREAWALASIRALKALLGADKGTLVMPSTSAPMYVSEDVARHDCIAYPLAISPLDRRLSVWERQHALGAFDRPTLWGTALPRMLASPYYHEFVVPLRLHDATGLTRHLGGMDTRITGDTVACLWLHHDRPGGRKFGERGLALLRLLYPAFTAGAELSHRAATAHRSVMDGLDAQGVAALCIDAHGGTVHRTKALDALLGPDPERAAVIGAAAAAAGALAHAMECHERGRGSLMAAREAMARRVRTRTGTYTVRTTLPTPPPSGLAPIAVAVVQREASLRVAAETFVLSERYGLTPAQARVATLLAAGRSVADIARQLTLSPHTVRRHLEQIRRRCGTHSTAAATAMLLRADGAA